MEPRASLGSYAAVTAAYWGFTLTDGALRMLVLLHFHTLGFTPFQLAFLFVLYEFFGILTNLFGGWLGARFGLTRTLYAGLGLQIGALLMLSATDPLWALTISVAYVTAAQGLSGIAKDLTKMSSKSALKLVLPDGAHGRLFRWVALLTGSKNALKGVGFFLGAVLLETVGFEAALWIMAGALALVLLAVLAGLRQGLGKAKAKVPIRKIFSKTREINRLAAARFFLFGARDVWFVVAVPVFFYSVLGWSFSQVGAFMALWVIGYGFVQAAAPIVVRRSDDGRSSETRAARTWVFVLMLLPLAIVGAFYVPEVWRPEPVTAIVGGLALFGAVFAVNSAVHSYLILAYTDGPDDVALNVGFYYMANAAGRLVGTLLSGLTFQAAGLEGSLLAASVLLAAAFLWTLTLPVRPSARPASA